MQNSGKSPSWYAFYLMLFLNTNIGFSQSLDSFRVDFKRALSSEFSTAGFGKMMERHRNLLSFYTYRYQRSDSTQVSGVQFPLRTFRSDTLYYNNIHLMLASDSASQRELAFLVIGAVGDSSMTKPLLQRMMTEENASLLHWGGMSLFLIGCQETTPIFDLLIKHEAHGSDFFLGAYLRLNKDSLLYTGLNRIENNKRSARILAARSLGSATKTPASEKALRKAVQEWDIHEKGYAIFSLKQLQAGNLRSLLKPWLSQPMTKNIALEALVESPSPKDFRFVKRFVQKSSPISLELLTCFYKSTKSEAVEHWLYLLRTKPLSEGYFNFSVYDQPLLTTDDLLPKVLETLKKATDPRVLQKLSRALQGRSDALSVYLILDLLHHPDPATRYWVAEWNKNCRSSILAKEIPALLSNPELRVSPLATMAIANNVDSLQILFEGIYKDPPASDWKYASLTYMASFPKSNHRSLFQELLKTNDQQWGIGTSQQASLGLGRLGDAEADELIIASSRIWRKGSDSNAYYHLLALKMLKTEKAKLEIQQYLNSTEPRMREFAKQTLDNW
ncbi:MAG: HEAT repeat domain-containing protein [Saprospiraceae bacterium]|nr:HEAT repeat domain-containing protein [Saprospiraceae bacterium]